MFFLILIIDEKMEKKAMMEKKEDGEEGEEVFMRNGISSDGFREERKVKEWKTKVEVKKGK